MRFKKSKAEILEEMERTYPWASFANGHNMATLSPNELKIAIEEYGLKIARSVVRETIKVLLNNIYTQEEFEHDLISDQNKKS